MWVKGIANLYLAVERTAFWICKEYGGCSLGITGMYDSLKSCIFQNFDFEQTSIHIFTGQYLESVDFASTYSKESAAVAVSSVFVGIILLFVGIRVYVKVKVYRRIKWKIVSRLKGLIYVLLRIRQSLVRLVW